MCCSSAMYACVSVSKRCPVSLLKITVPPSVRIVCSVYRTRGCNHHLLLPHGSNAANRGNCDPLRALRKDVRIYKAACIHRETLGTFSQCPLSRPAQPCPLLYTKTCLGLPNFFPAIHSARLRCSFFELSFSLLFNPSGLLMRSSI